MSAKILIIGACGQIGSELAIALRAINKNKNVIASDIREGSKELMSSGPFELIDATNKENIIAVINKRSLFNGSNAFCHSRKTSFESLAFKYDFLI